MRVIPILPMTDARLVSSSVSAAETPYDPAETCAIDVLRSVITADSHRLFRSLANGNIGHDPATSPSWWFDEGLTNRWKMFSLLSNAPTVGTSPLIAVLAPAQRINSIALKGLVADSARVVMTSVLGGGTVFDYTEPLSTRQVFGYYDYCFEPFSTRESVVRFDLPPYSDGIVTLTLTRAAGEVSCGSCDIGTYVFIGDIEYAGQNDALNFSKVTRDDYGTATLIPRRDVPQTSQTLELDKSRVNKVRALRSAVKASVAVWAGLNDSTDGYAEAFLIRGFARKFTINAAYPTKAKISLELEEV